MRALPLLAATLSATEPLPVPLFPVTTEIHGAVLDACQPHPLGAASETVREPPDAETCPDVLASVTRQAAAAWLIAARWPLTVTPPWRTVASGLGAAWNVTCALPCPDAGESDDIQLASVDALHVHSGGVATETLPVPPAAPIGDEGAVTVTSHLSGDGPTAVVVEVAPHAAVTAATINGPRALRYRCKADHVATRKSFLGVVIGAAPICFCAGSRLTRCHIAPCCDSSAVT